MQSYFETAMGLDVVDYTCRQDAPSCLTFPRNIQGFQSGGGPRKARQEWAKLMVEGNPRWQHPLIFQHFDARGRPRGSMNLKRVVCICGAITRTWDMARWRLWISSCSFGSIIYESGWTQWGDLTGPLSLPERKKIVQESKHSKPGPSYWKIAFLAFFRAWAPGAYWHLIDTQRKCRISPFPPKNATQFYLDKPSGSFRPLTMLEESFKPIEGPPARRKALKRI